MFSDGTFLEWDLLCHGTFLEWDVSRAGPFVCAPFKRLFTPLLQIVKERWIAACDKSYLHAALHHLFTIFRNVSTTSLKITIKQLHKQLTINKQTDNSNKISKK
jgi:hypothetical protein